jgi:hypothetical protein
MTSLILSSIFCLSSGCSFAANFSSRTVLRMLYT